MLTSKRLFDIDTLKFLGKILIFDKGMNLLSHMLHILSKYKYVNLYFVVASILNDSILKNSKLSPKIDNVLVSSLNIFKFSKPGLDCHKLFVTASHNK